MEEASDIEEEADMGAKGQMPPFDAVKNIFADTKQNKRKRMKGGGSRRKF